MSPFLRAEFEYFFVPEGTHNTLITPPLSKESEKTLNEEPEKMSDTCRSGKIILHQDSLRSKYRYLVQYKTTERYNNYQIRENTETK